MTLQPCPANVPHNQQYCTAVMDVARSLNVTGYCAVPHRESRVCRPATFKVSWLAVQCATRCIPQALEPVSQHWAPPKTFPLNIVLCSSSMKEAHIQYEFHDAVVWDHLADDLVNNSNNLVWGTVHVPI